MSFSSSSPAATTRSNSPDLDSSTSDSINADDDDAVVVNTPPSTPSTVLLNGKEEVKESDPEPFSIPCTVSPSRPCTRSSLRSICENKSDSEGSSSDGSELQLESTESDNSVTLQSDDDEPVPESEYDFSDDNPVSTVINGKDEVKESSSLPTVPMANIPLVTPPRYNTRSSHRSPESDHQELMDHAYALRVQRELQFERSAGSSNKATGSSSSTSNRCHCVVLDQVTGEPDQAHQVHLCATVAT